MVSNNQIRAVNIKKLITNEIAHGNFRSEWINSDFQVSKLYPEIDDLIKGLVRSGAFNK